MDLRVTSNERSLLRELAKKQADCAHLPIMEDRTRRWYDHNACRGDVPMIIMEHDSFPEDVFTLVSESPLAREMETVLKSALVPILNTGDDTVTPDTYRFDIPVEIDRYGFQIRRNRALDTSGHNIGFQDEHPISSIKEDFKKLKPATFFYDRVTAERKLDAVSDIISDILPVELENTQHRWSYMFTNELMSLMGMEQWMISMYDEPEQVHRIMEYLYENSRRFIRFQEIEGLLTMNNGNHYIGAGSRGFTRDLQPEPDGRVLSRDIWLNTNSQESSSISPDMYEEFVFPYIRKLAEEAGFLYYGCCEAAHPFWDRCLKTLPNLRKISISAWCDEEYMGDALRGTKIIYSRKPKPNFIGVDPVFQEKAFREHINRTLHAAKGCTLEFIFRDIYTLMGDPLRARRAVQIVREQIDKEWGK